MTRYMPVDSWGYVATGPELAHDYASRGWWDGSTLASLVRSGTASASDQRVAIYSQVRPFQGTVRDVADAGRRFAGGLHSLGIRPGDVVAFQLPNWMEAAATFWGTTTFGAIVLPIPHFYGLRELEYILHESGARVLVVADRFGKRDHLGEVESMRDRLPQLEHIVLVGDSVTDWTTPFDTLIDATPLSAEVRLDPAGPAVLAYTSGTSATTKGVVLSHRAMSFEVRAHMAALDMPSRPLVSGSPVTHIAGMLTSLLVPLIKRGPIHLVDVWDPTSVLGLVRDENLSAGSGAAIFLLSLVDHPETTPDDLARIEFAALGGSPVPTAMAERMQRLGIDIARVYGCTEHPTISMGRRDDPPHKRAGTDGRPSLGVDVRIVDGAGADVPTGVAGEILSRGPDRCDGYIDPALNADTFREGGWFVTGDIGVLDEDGYLRITDRAKDIIIRGGENISAAEVEQLLLGLPDLVEVAVVAVPDSVFGERACAVVRSRPNAAAPDLPAVRSYLATTGLAKQKWPETLIAVDEFPRTPSGKIKKSELRAALAGTELRQTDRSG
jgi:acyl-CoA synthetase (AMP-forming)/AMP-acid ligase II